MSGDEVSELRRDIADMSKAQAVHYERMENGQERMLEKLGEAVVAMKDCAKKSSNGNGSVPYRNGNGGISARFVLQIIGLLLAAVVLMASGQRGVDAVIGFVTHIVEAKTK